MNPKNYMFPIMPITSDVILGIPIEEREETDDPIDLIKQARQSKYGVIEMVLTIERKMEEIIALYFFEKDTKASRMFKVLILESDFSFASKRKLLKHVVGDLDLIKQKKDRENFDNNIGKIMSYRNAYAHGRFQSNGKSVWLTYFEGVPQRKELTYEYTFNINKKLHSTYQQMREVLKTLENRLKEKK